MSRFNPEIQKETASGISPNAYALAHQVELSDGQKLKG